jgi:hypothetical protein
MENKLNRRNILKLSFFTGLVSAIPNKIFGAEIKLDATTPPANENIYLAKHGDPKMDTKFLWSTMYVSKETQVIKDITAIIKKYKYYTELNYKSNDRFKIDPAKEIITYLLNSKDVTFDMVLYNNLPANFRDISKAKYNKKQTVIFEKLLKVGDKKTVVQKSEDRYGPSDAYKTKFNAKHGRDNITKDAKGDYLLQVNDLISGLCYSTLNPKTIKSSTKNNLNIYFNTICNLKPIINQPKIIIKNITINTTTSE